MCILTVQCMMVAGLWEKGLAEACRNGQMVEVMKVNGLTKRSMARVK